MAYRCPVCGSAEVDAEHLANHLAFTAVIRGDDHEDWLDDHTAGWDEQGPAELAPKVAEAVPEVDVPALEGTDGDDHDHGGGRLEEELASQASHRGPGAGETAGTGGRGDLTDEAAGVMAEARELTARMYGLDDIEADETADGGAVADVDDGDADGGDTGHGDADGGDTGHGDADGGDTGHGDADGGDTGHGDADGGDTGHGDADGGDTEDGDGGEDASAGSADQRSE